jgi:LAO/AO transport system kinase|tara:strand:- start:6882 stop:7829 length:948 start_codon:yes stop_codon:yes gene_type:complete
MPQALIPGILDNEAGSISKAITCIENEQRVPDSFFRDLHENSSRAIRIGITGPPGAGKSTLTNELIETCLANNKKVGVIAVDPTSPFSGGALLGDRVRMNKYLWDDRVFIRSMGSHGDLGGLARKAQEAGDVLAASGKDIILFETVGVGQGEHDVAKAADFTIVILVPESGDEIQLMKAGLIEIADIFVINKSDRDGANRLASLLKNILHNFTARGKLEPPVFNTIANQGQGIVELFMGVQDHLKLMSENGMLELRRLSRYRNRVSDLIRERLEDDFWTEEKKAILDHSTQSLNSIKSAPVTMAQQLLDRQSYET